MDILSLLVLALGLSMDVFAVSLGVSTSNLKPSTRSRMRMAFHFGLFQGGMTAMGWLAGTELTRWITSIDHWVAFILLVLVGGRMIQSGLTDRKETHLVDPSRGTAMIMLCIATSLDALAVGIGLAFVDGMILVPSLVIGAVSSILSLIGSSFGCRLGDRFGRQMVIIGGTLLIGIGLRILITHLTSRY